MLVSRLLLVATGVESEEFIQSLAAGGLPCGVAG
jgi:hypothetical protein